MFVNFPWGKDKPKLQETSPKAILLNMESVLKAMEVPEERLCEIELPKDEYIECVLNYIANKDLVERGIEAICDEVYHTHQREFGEAEATAAKDVIEILCKGLYSKLEQIGAYQESGDLLYTEIGMFDGKRVLLIPENNDPDKHS